MGRTAGVISALMTLSSLAQIARGGSSYDYAKALELSFHFFEAQRSGYLPANDRISWRFNSGLNDGKSEGVRPVPLFSSNAFMILILTALDIIDLTGGYYDAGDNVKFGLPMAFTITMLSWSVVEYGSQLQEQGQLQAALDSIKWGTDYFVKAHPEPNVLWAEVGDGNTDHYCWERPEDMTTPRQAYRIDTNNPGSEVAAETAAAMAAASIVYGSVDEAYSETLLTHARQLFSFADTYRGRYDSSIPIVKQYYGSGPSGYADELLWAALWLFEATTDEYYLRYAIDNAQSLGGTGWAMTEFGWDVKYSGLQVMAAKVLLRGGGWGEDRSTLEAYQGKAEFFMCSVTGRGTQAQLARSPGGMFWTQAWNNMQFVTSAAFLLTVYADALNAANVHQISCSGSPVQTADLLDAGKSQVNYILGNNPRGMSYMVGYGNSFPQFVHHRGASIPSIKVDGLSVGCREGYSTWYSSPQANPNVLVGAVVGGPDQSDNYVDRRDNWEGSEACVYNNAPLVGLLARLSASSESAEAAQDVGETMTRLKLTQQPPVSWKVGSVVYYKHGGALINNSDRPLKDFVLTFDELDGVVYGLRQIKRYSFTFPASQASLMRGKSLRFVYTSRRSKPTSITLHLPKFA